MDASPASGAATAREARSLTRSDWSGERIRPSRATLQERQVAVAVVRDDHIIEAVAGAKHERRHRVQAP